MKNPIRNGYSQLLPNAIIRVVAFFLVFGSSGSFAASPEVSATSRDTLRLGERIYREGILPSGKPLQASVKGEHAVPGLTFTCVSCHLRSGLGSFDEGVFTPPINGKKLFQPLPRQYKGVEQGDNTLLTPLRPGYTDKFLIEALRNGRDPNGRMLSEAMPRYLLGDDDSRLLITYLKSLSAQFSPGVSDTNIRFATVISADIRPEISNAMLATFAAYFNMKNSQIRTFSNPRSGAKSRRMAESMFLSRELAAKTISLSRWTLKGPPETWRSQLEEYNRKEPVFALLGGIVSGQWKPVHQFCEDNGIPCLFPNSDFPVVSDSDWYTLYMSKGYYQEGEGAARYLNDMAEMQEGKQVIQIVRDSPEAKALSAGFLQTWQDLGQKAPSTILLSPGKTLDRDVLQQALSRKKTTTLVIWDDAASLPVLELISRREDRPEMIFLSARYLGKSVWAIKESIRDFTYLTYPFAFSPIAAKPAMGKQKPQDDLKKTLRQAEIPLKDEVRKVESLTNSLTQVLTFMLMDLKGNYYRDNLLDVAGMITDQQHPLYGRISFGTGQRYSSRGCFIVQLAQGENPELVKKSNWIIH